MVTMMLLNFQEFHAAFFLLDDAEFAVGRRGLGAGGECQPSSGYILQIPTSEPRLPGYHQPQSSVSF